MPWTLGPIPVWERHIHSFGSRLSLASSSDHTLACFAYQSSPNSSTRKYSGRANEGTLMPSLFPFMHVHLLICVSNWGSFVFLCPVCLFSPTVSLLACFVCSFVYYGTQRNPSFSFLCLRPFTSFIHSFHFFYFFLFLHPS